MTPTPSPSAVTNALAAMDQETIRLIGVAVTTLLAGVIAAGVSAYVTLRTNHKDRQEARLAWKRDKIVDLVAQTIEAGNESEKYFQKRRMMEPERDGINGAIKSLFLGLSERAMVLDSGLIAEYTTNFILTHIHRLNLVVDEPDSAERVEKLKKLEEESREALGGMIGAVRLLLDDPSASKNMRHLRVKILKAQEKRGKSHKHAKVDADS